MAGMGSFRKRGARKTKARVTAESREADSLDGGTAPETLLGFEAADLDLLAAADELLPADELVDWEAERDAVLDALSADVEPLLTAEEAADLERWGAEGRAELAALLDGLSASESRSRNGGERGRSAGEAGATSTRRKKMRRRA